MRLALTPLSREVSVGVPHRVVELSVLFEYRTGFEQIPEAFSCKHFVPQPGVEALQHAVFLRRTGVNEQRLHVEFFKGFAYATTDAFGTLFAVQEAWIVVFVEHPSQRFLSIYSCMCLYR